MNWLLCGYFLSIVLEKKAKAGKSTKAHQTSVVTSWGVMRDLVLTQQARVKFVEEAQAPLEIRAASLFFHTLRRVGKLARRKFDSDHST